MRLLNLKKLGDFLNRRMQQMRLNDRDVDILSKNRVSYGTVNRIRNNRNDDIRLSSLQGISAGIGVPVEYLVALALNQEPNDRTQLTEEEQELITSFRRLPFETQAFILQSIKSFSPHESTSSDPSFAPVKFLSAPVAVVPTPQKKGAKK